MTFPSRTPHAEPRIGPRRPAPAPARPRHLRVVRSRPAPGRRPPASTLIVASLATAAALFGLVSVQSLVGQTQIRSTEIARRVDQKKDALEALEVDVARMSALDFVARRATDLGLVVPPAIAFLPAPDEAAAPSAFESAVVPSYVEPRPASTPASKTTPSAKPSPAPSSGGR